MVNHADNSYPPPAMPAGHAPPSVDNAIMPPSQAPTSAENIHDPSKCQASYSSANTEQFSDSAGESHPTSNETPYSDPSRLGIELEPDTDSQSGHGTEHAEPVTNPLFHGSSAYTTDIRGRPTYLGTSSNWAFARRILIMAHTKVSGGPLPSDNLIFEGATYELGWDGRRLLDATSTIALPTTDFAMYLINSVKFHATQLFHLFDHESFMESFSKYHDSHKTDEQSDTLWLTHYCMILALGKAFVGRAASSNRPPGVEFFIHGMKMLPDVTLLCYGSNTLQAMEIFCCAALYLQCLDMRSAAYNLVRCTVQDYVPQGRLTNTTDWTSA